jgi:hypothetical protein
MTSANGLDQFTQIAIVIRRTLPDIHDINSACFPIPHIFPAQPAGLYWVQFEIRSFAANL